MIIVFYGKKYKDKKLTDQSKLTHKALKSRIKEAKTPYYNMKIATSKDRIKTTWNVVKSLTSRSNIQGLINVIKIGDPLVLDQATISQYFNKHFSLYCTELILLIITNHVTILIFTYSIYIQPVELFFENQN